VLVALDVIFASSQGVLISSTEEVVVVKVEELEDELEDEEVIFASSQGVVM